MDDTRGWLSHPSSPDLSCAWLAVASDESFVDIVDVQTGQQVWEVRPTEDAPITSISWHPKRLSLALACERQSDYKGFYVLNADRS